MFQLDNLDLQKNQRFQESALGQSTNSLENAYEELKNTMKMVIQKIFRYSDRITVIDRSTQRQESSDQSVDKSCTSAPYAYYRPTDQDVLGVWNGTCSTFCLQ